jgi:hypothetical protein
LLAPALLHLLLLAEQRTHMHNCLLSAWRCREMVHRLFQEAGAGVHLNKFRAFLQRLQEGMLRLEFAHYDITGAQSWHTAYTMRSREDVLLLFGGDESRHCMPQQSGVVLCSGDDVSSCVLVWIAFTFCAQ